MIKQKVLLAINNLKMENFIMKQLKAEFEFVKAVSYRAGLLSNIENQKPDIVVITEDLKGNESLTKIVYEIFKSYNNIRVVFISNERPPGDKVLNALINYKVYDLVIGDEVKVNEIIHHIRVPSSYHDVAHLHVVEVVDETSGETLFEIPDYERPKERIVEVVKKVYIDTSPKNQNNQNNFEDIPHEYDSYIPFETSLEDLDSIIGTNEYGQEVKVKDVIPENHYYYNGYFFNQINDDIYYLYHEGYFFDKDGLPYVNYNNKLITYDEFSLIQADEFVIETSDYDEEQEILKEEELRKEELRKENELRLEQEQLEKERLEQEHLEKERKAKLIQDRIAQEKEEEERKRYLGQLEKERQLQERIDMEEKIKEEKLRKQEEEERRRFQEMKEQEDLKLVMNNSKKNQEEESVIPARNDEQRDKRFMSMFGGKTQNQMIQSVSSSNKKLITFVGSRGGAGTSTIAFNTAVALANQKSKVLYVEYNYKSPSSTILYDIAYTQKGIDSALKGLEKSDLLAIEDAMIHFDELKKKKIQGNPFKSFPNSLSVMTFSKEFIVNYHKRMKDFDESFTRELFLYFLFQSEFDYIILDMQLEHITNETMYQSLFLSQKICLVVLPDISYIGYATYHINEWANKSILLNNRLEILVNRFEKTKLNQKVLKDWLETNNLFIFPDVTKLAIEANYDSVPLYLKGNNPFKEMINTLLNQIK